MSQKKFPQTEVVLPNGERFKTDMPVKFGLKRTIIQQYLRPGLYGIDVFSDFSNGERKRSQSFNLGSAIKKAKESSEGRKGGQVMIKQNDTRTPSPLDEVQKFFDQKLFARTHTTHFLPERSAARGDYITSGDLDDLFAQFQAVHELHLKHKREGLPPPRF